MIKKSFLMALLLVSHCHAQSAEEVRLPPHWFTRSILPTNLPLVEAQNFTDARIPSMPEPASAADWTRQSNSLRKQMLNEIVFRGKARQWARARTKVEWLETMEGGPGYKIQKLRYEALPGLWIPALLYRPDGITGKAPVFLNVNGHEGVGKAVDYKQLRCINMAKRGILTLNPDWLGMGQLNHPDFLHYRMNQIDLCGASGLAPFYLAMSRALDLLLDLPEADRSRVGVSGLSGGGWQTIFISSLDTRVTLANPVAGYSSFKTRARHVQDLGDSEQTPNDMATVADYAHLTAMMAPRPLLLTYNSKDQCCFASGHALEPLLQAAGPIYGLFGKSDKLQFHVNHDPGTHNFEQENREALYGVIANEFGVGDRLEIISKNEIKSAEELNVPLPDNNLNFQLIATRLAASLPEEGEPPRSPGGVWKDRRRETLWDITKAHEYTLKTERIETFRSPGGRVTFWKMVAEDQWTFPVSEFIPDFYKGLVLLVGDAGRNKLQSEVGHYLSQGMGVLTIDPLLFGENRISSHEFLYGLLISSTGERPLGIQSSQVLALSHWAWRQHQMKMILASSGPRSGLINLVAAALDPEPFLGVEQKDPLNSLKEIIHGNWSVDKRPEWFCFGLLKEFEISHFKSMIHPLPVGGFSEAAFLGEALSE